MKSTPILEGKNANLEIAPNHEEVHGEKENCSGTWERDNGNDGTYVEKEKVNEMRFHANDEKSALTMDVQSQHVGPSSQVGQKGLPGNQENKNVAVEDCGSCVVGETNCVQAKVTGLDKNKAHCANTNESMDGLQTKSADEPQIPPKITRRSVGPVVKLGQERRKKVANQKSPKVETIACHRVQSME